MESYLSQLNEPQRKAVETLDGPVIIIAGAGSGKTRVLTYRIAHLIKRGINPFNILSLTFTNKAAKEMKKRISEIVGADMARNLWMGTFHSVFARILRFEADKLGYPNNFTIYDTQDSQRLISAIIKEINLDKDVYKYKQIQSRISSYKNSLITVKAFFNNPDLMEAEAIAKRPRIGEIYKEYVARCFKAGAMDFDDLLLKTNELLTTFPEVLIKYQDKFRYIMVDEYQDTNHSQYLIVRALADRFQNICVVGDDSQSIYAFRGANINNILNFRKDFDDVKTFRLEQNYRSTKNIVLAANSVIENNKNRLDKEVWTHNDDGNKIKIHRSTTDSDEGRYVAESIFESKMQHQLKHGDFAVLYRTNRQSRAVEDALRKRDIPYRIYGGLSFYQRKEVKDILAYLRLIINTKDEEALMRIINYPARGIGVTTLDKIVVAANHYKRPIFDIIEHIDTIDLQIAASTKNRLKDFVIMTKSFQIANQSKNAYEVTEQVIKKTGLFQFLKKDGSPEGVSRFQNIEELLNGISDFIEGQKEVENATGSLSEFLQDVALITDMDKDIEDENRVALMTIHLAKGLEFPYVYLVGLEENLFPSAMSINTREELEEERRLFYVALTRAEKQVYITYTEMRYLYGDMKDADPSRFISEIPNQFTNYLNPIREGYQYQSPLSKDIFGEINKSKLRQIKPVRGIPPKEPFQEKLKKLRKIKPNYDKPIGNNKSLKLSLKEGIRISHERFGHGEIINIEGTGNDKRVEIDFDNAGIKKIILRFANLKIVNV